MNRFGALTFRGHLGRITLLTLVTAAAALPAAAVTHQLDILLDLDNDPGTGCAVSTVEGPFAGVEQILRSVVETEALPTPSATVTEVLSLTCAGGVTFDPPTVVDPGDWPVGVGLGVEGTNVIETYVPSNLLPPDLDTIRLAVVLTSEGGEEAALLFTSPGSGLPILLVLAQAVIEIPTLSQWGLVALALLLAGLAARRLRRPMVATMLGLLLVFGAAGVAWAAVLLDGDPSDWTPGSQLASDPLGGPCGGLHIAAFFAKPGAGQLCFRVDACLLFNNPPVAADDAFTTDEDVPVAGNVLADNGAGADSDPNGDALTVETAPVTAPANGGVVLAANGDFTYTPNPDFNGVDSFEYRVLDGNGGSDIGTVTITVGAVNDAPVAVADAAAVAEGGTLTEPAPGVLANDTDVDGDPLTAVLVTGPANAASFTLDPDGSFSYTHDGGETTTDSFTYRANDGTADSNVATVTITVNAVNDAPVAVDDGYAVDEGATLTEPAPGVLGNDTDAEADPLTAVLVTGPTNAASFTLDADGSFEYTHDGSETTSDSFTYRAHDGALDSNIATVTITVNAVNDAPVAVDDGYAVAEGGTLNEALPGVLGNDTDGEGDALTAALVTGPANAASFTLDPDGSFDYTHDGSETTTDSFTYRANDGTADSNVATVTITVTAVNDAPVADDDAYGVAEGGTVADVAPGVLAGDTDAEGDPLQAALVTGPSHASAFALDTDGSFSYTHDGSETPLTDSFTYQATDGALSSNVATVTITISPVNDPPVLDLDADDSGLTPGADFAITFTDGDPATFLEDVTDATITDADSANLETLTVTLTNLLDPGDEVLDVDLTGADVAFSKTYDPTTDPTQGVLTISAAGGRPIAEFVDLLRKVSYVNTDDDLDTTDRIVEFVANDGTAASNIATTTVTIVAVNDAPTADDDAYAVDEGGTLNEPAPGVLTGDTDPEGDSLDAMLDSGPANASSFTLNADGSFSYVHDGSETTTDSFTYHANDGGLDSNVATVTITVNALNDAPVADDDAYAVDEGAALVQPAPGVLDGDTDAEGDTLSAVLDSGPANASSFTLNADGSFSYVHNGSETTSDSFTYHAHDGTADSNVATVTITINPVNDPPVAVDDAYAVDEGATLAEAAPGVLGNDTDAEGTTPTAVIDSGPSNAASFTLNADGSFSYEHNGSETTTDAFTYHAHDGTADSNVATVTITINPVNDAPVADADAYAVDEGATLIEAAPGVLAGDTDAEGTTLTAVLDSGPAHATSFTLNADGSFTYQHNGSETTTDSFTYHASDGELDSNVATVTITVNPVNDPPVAVDDANSVTEEAPNDADPANNTALGNVLGNDTDVDSTLSVGTVTGGSVGSPVAGSFGAVTINADGSYTYVLDDANPTVNGLQIGGMLTDTFTYTASDGALSDPATLTITIHGADDPAVPDDDAFDFIGNTQLLVDRAAVGTPHALETTAPDGIDGVLEGDVDPDGGGVIQVSNVVGCGDLSAPFDCTIAGDGTVSLDADGSFSFIPEAGDADGTATFQYQLVGNVINVGTVTLTRHERVWYVDPTNGDAGSIGTSVDPFDTLADVDGAGGAGDDDVAGDYIFVHDGSLTLTAPMELEASQHLIGQGVALSIPVDLNGNGSPTVLLPAGTHPELDLTGGGDLVRIGNAIPVEIRGFGLESDGNLVDLTATGGALTGSSSLAIANNQMREANGGIDVNLVATTSGQLNLAITDNAWDVTGVHGGNAIDVANASTAADSLRLDVSRNTSIEASGTAIMVLGAFLAGNNPNTTIVGFAANTIHGDSVNGVMLGNVEIDAVAGGVVDNVSAGTWTIGTSGNPVGGSGMVLGTVGGSLSFTDLDVYAASGGALMADGFPVGAGSLSLTVAASMADLHADFGPAVEINDATIDLQLATMSSDDSAAGLTHGVSFTRVDGTFSAPSGATITDAGGTAFHVDDADLNVTYNGTITDDQGPLVTISSSNAGTKSFTGAITDGEDGDGGGIQLTNNGGTTMSFSGGVTLSTGATAAFTATGGGTLNVTGTNRLTTTTATALNVANTNIGASDITFRSISSNGGANSGIVLNNTGAAGGLIVTGAGGAGTGGTIQNKTVNGISLQNTRDVSLTSMIVNNNDGSGIFGDDLTNFSLIGSSVTNNADTATGVEANLRFHELLGTSAITNSTISGSSEDEIRITPTSGVLTNLAVSGSQIGPNSAATGGHGLAWIATGTATGTVTITGTSFSTIRSQGALMNVADTAVGTLNVSTSTFQNPGAAVTLQSSGSADLNFDISNNTQIVDAISNAIQLVAGSTSTTSSQIRGTISGNVIGDGTVDSGSRDMFGIALDLRGNQDAVIEVSNNQVSNTDFEGIWVSSADFGVIAGDGVLDLTLRDNTVGTPDDNSGFPVAFIRGTLVDVRHTTTACLDMASNTSAGVGGAEHFRVRQRDTSVFRIERLTDGDAIPNELIANAATVEAHVVAQNDAGSTADATFATGFTEAADGVCRTP